MTQQDRLLAFVLRLIGVTSLLSLVAVVMPFSWMRGIHQWLALGEMPSDVVVEYLARSTSIWYALFGALCLALATDVDRYRPLLRFVGVFAILGGLLLTVVDAEAGMPVWWTASEGPAAIVMGIAIVVLARDGD
jgi:hypothetical protein